MRATYSDSETMSITETSNEVPSESPTPSGDMGDTPTSEPVEAVNQEPSEPVEPTEPGERYTVKIDGEEQEVSLDELRNGYQRQQVFTKRTQELAEARKRLGAAEALATALDKDPINTLKALNEAYQVGDTKVSQEEWDEMDPQEQRVARLEQELGSIRARDARSTIDTEFRALEAEFGDIDRHEIASHALKNDLTVTQAYRDMNFDNIRQERERFASEAKVVDSKRNAKLPHSGSGAQRGAVSPNTQGKKMSVRESYLAAVKQQAGA